MAGGMYGKGVDAASAMQRIESADRAQEARRTPRHCWIVGVDGVPDRTPALLIAWDKEVGSWSGRVVYCIEERGGPMIIHRWLSSEHLQPG